jgi:hypothetical protein
MPSGGLIQLMAYGGQEVYFTSNPQHTFFRTIYRRHTNFALFDQNQQNEQNQYEQNEFINQYDINKWIIKYVIILETDRNMDCPINLDAIKLNDQYCRCTQCKYNFSKEALIESFKTNYTCPMCRAEWSDKTLYVNKNEEIKKSSDKNKKSAKSAKSTKSDIISLNTYKAENKIKLTRNNKRFFYGR